MAHTRAELQKLSEEQLRAIIVDASRRSATEDLAAMWMQTRNRSKDELIWFILELED